MNFDYKNLLPEGFVPESRVWIYQSSRQFTLSEALEIEKMLEDFVQKWNAHGEKVKGYANLLFGRFIILMADETTTGVSGCSTDSSVRLIKSIEQQFGVNMFDRNMLAFIINGKIELLPLPQINYAVENGFISGDTLYFNNLADTRKSLENDWLVPVKNSWLMKKINAAQSAKS